MIMGDLSSEQKLLDSMKERFSVSGRVQREKRVIVPIKKEDVVSVCSWLQEQGFVHLSSISAIDWLKENVFEVTYHLWSYDQHMIVAIKTKLPRDNPVTASLCPVYDNNAQIHEREIHELFGITFQGNPDLSPLFVEDWEGPPAFRRDFDWKQYVQEKYYHTDRAREKGYYD